MTLSVVAARLGLTAGVVGATTTSVEALRDGYDALPASRVEHADGGRRTDPADTTSPRPCLDPRSIGLVAATRQQIATNSAGTPKGPSTVTQTETYAPSPMKPSAATGAWDDFLGSGQTNINPRTGLPDPNRVFSADGTRSIRFGPHEMNSSSTKFHFHQETWTYDPVANTWHVDNVVQRVPLKK